MILAFILDNQLDNAKTVNKWDMDTGKILFTLSYVKYKQFDFSYRKKSTFPSILQELLGVLFQLELKVKGIFLFRI